MSKTAKHHPRHRRRRKILFTSGIAAIGLASLLAQGDLPTAMVEKMEKSDRVMMEEGLPGQPTNGFPTVKKLPPQDEGERPPEEFIDPQQVKEALRNIADLKREIQRLVKDFSRIQGSGAEVKKLNELLVEVKKFEANIRAAQKSGEGLRDVMQEYWDAQIWDTVNQSRRTVDIPRQVAQITKELKRLESLLKGKSFQKLPFDQAALKNNIESIRTAMNEAKAAYEAGDLESADDALQPINDGMHPGEVMGVLYRFRDLAGMSNRIKDKEARAAIDEVIGPVVEAVNDGDFREANSILNDSFDDLMRLMRLASQLGSSRKANRSSINDLIDKLEQRISDKADSFDQGDQGQRE